MPAKVDHDARRKELLSASFSIFARDGYAACTMRGLAKSLGVSTGTLYHYFDGKPALFAAMFQWVRDRDIRAATEGVPADATQAERLARLGMFLQEHEENLVRAVRIALDYHRHQDDPASRQLIAETVRDYQIALRESLGLDDHPQLARVLLSFLLGMSVHRILDPESVEVVDHLAVLGVAADAIVGLDQ